MHVFGTLLSCFLTKHNLLESLSDDKCDKVSPAGTHAKPSATSMKYHNPFPSHSLPQDVINHSQGNKDTSSSKACISAQRTDGGKRRLAEHCFVTIHYSFRTVATGRPLAAQSIRTRVFLFCFFFSQSYLQVQRNWCGACQYFTVCHSTKKSVLKRIVVLEQRAQCKT